ncbi:MAG: recombinase family protein [Bacillota bacterium]
MPEHTRFQTAIYARLSVENSKDTKEKDIIENQIKECKYHIAEKNDLHLVRVYRDDGYSGRNFDRPAFLQLLRDIEQGKVDCIVVKDLSRLGRNVVAVGYYLEQYFPEKKVRFIAVNDKIDTQKIPTHLELQVVLKSMVHEIYAIETSKKIKLAKQQEAKNGKFIGSIAPYGYEKDTDNPKQLRIDRETANIVTMIFDWFVSGKSVYAICKMLNEREIPTPTQYRKMKNPKNNNRVSMSWQQKTVKEMLSSEVYLGHLVQNKSSRKKNCRAEAPPLIVKHTHSPIVSERVFALAKERLSAIALENQHVSFAEKRKIYDPLQGKIECGTCRKNFRLQKSGKYVCKTNREYMGAYCTNETNLPEAVIHSILEKWFANCGTVLLLRKKERELQGIKKDVRVLQSAIKSEENKRKQQFEVYAKNEITKEAYLSFRKNSDVLLQKLKERLHVLFREEESIFAVGIKKEELYACVWRIVCKENFKIEIVLR